MQVVCLSDTHGHHGTLRLPPGDVLLHAGDFTHGGTVAEARAFLAWFSRAGTFTHRILIAGNHDLVFDRDAALARTLLPPNVTYLQDSGVTCGGVTFWGSPVTPAHADYAFMKDPRDLPDHWARVPAGVDVLVTHGPPADLLDELHGGLHVGCPALLHALDRVRPAVHVFGHIHEGRGSQLRAGTVHVNAANCDRHNRPAHPPTVLHVSRLQASQVQPGGGRYACRILSA